VGFSSAKNKKKKKRTEKKKNRKEKRNSFSENHCERITVFIIIIFERGLLLEESILTKVCYWVSSRLCTGLSLLQSGSFSQPFLILFCWKLFWLKYKRGGELDFKTFLKQFDIFQ